MSKKHRQDDFTKFEDGALPRPDFSETDRFEAPERELVEETVEVVTEKIEFTIPEPPKEEPKNEPPATQNVEPEAPKEDLEAKTEAEPEIKAEPEIESKPEASKEPEKKKKSKPRTSSRHTMPAVLRVLISVLLLAGMAVIIIWYIFWKQNFEDLEATSDFINENPTLTTWSGFIIFCLLAILAAATWRPFLSSGIIFSVAAIFMFINEQKMTLRNAPFIPDDLKMAGNAGELMDFVDTWAVVRLVVGVILIVAASALLEHSVRKVVGRNKKKYSWWERYSLIPRATFTMMGLAALVMAASPAVKRTPAEWMGVKEFVAWNQTRNYTLNGFVAGFIYNIAKSEIAPPDGEYSEAVMQKIAAEYKVKKAKDEAENERKPLSEIVENVIVILDETFYDPEVFSKYYAHRGEDTVPNLHRIFQDYPSGYMYSPEYGGNTANIEFEVQTGLTNFWAQEVPYPNIIPKTNGMLGVANFAKELGFNTTAIHSYDGTMYKRNIVYPLIGYNKFIDADQFKYDEKEYESTYINDRSVFREVLDILKENDDKQMVNVVTMQNHSPYEGANYPELEFELVPYRIHSIESSYQSVHEADKYLGEFIAALDELDEKTVVLWFGDHTAGILDAYVRSEDKNDQDTAHITPYFIYTNFEIDNPHTNEEVLAQIEELGIELELPWRVERSIDLPMTTPNCIQNTMYNLLGAKKPAKMYLLDEVCAEVPVLATIYMGDTKLPKSKAITDYEFVTYDAMGGKAYWWGD